MRRTSSSRCAGLLNRPLCPAPSCRTEPRPPCSRVAAQPRTVWPSDVRHGRTSLVGTIGDAVQNQDRDVDPPDTVSQLGGDSRQNSRQPPARGSRSGRSSMSYLPHASARTVRCDRLARPATCASRSPTHPRSAWRRSSTRCPTQEHQGRRSASRSGRLALCLRRTSRRRRRGDPRWRAPAQAALTPAQIHGCREAERPSETDRSLTAVPPRRAWCPGREQRCLAIAHPTLRCPPAPR